MAAVSTPAFGLAVPRRAVTGLVVALALGAAGVALLVRPAPEAPPPPAPAIRASDVREGAPAVDLDAVRAGRPAVVNFFAAWCEPCRDELPVLRAAAARETGVAFVGVDMQDSRTNAVELLDRFGIAYPAAYDPKGVIGASYGVRGLPATAFVSADGRVTEVVHGPLDADRLAELLSTLTWHETES